MALDTWLIKLKKTITQTIDSVRVTPPTKSPSIKKPTVGILAFEIAGIIPKLTHMWQFLDNIDQFHNQSLCLEGVCKIVSKKNDILFTLAYAETVENLRVISQFVSRLSKRCDDSRLRCFEPVFEAFSNTGDDPFGWVLLSQKDRDLMLVKMERYAAATASLYKAMDELSEIENNLKRSVQCRNSKRVHQEVKILDLQQKLLWQRQEVKYIKEKSLWNRSFDSVILLLATSIFTILSRIKVLSKTKNLKHQENQENQEISQLGFFENYSKILTPASTTLGFAGLSLHYANLIIVMEKMIRSPQLVGHDARDDLYSMLPSSIRSSLRRRLKGVVGFAASDPVLAGEWREALEKILGWLSPLAYNMIKWQNERSFEHQNLVPKTNVLLMQTLFFANREKAEAAITELLVGLNYIWRFEKEMNSKALLRCIVPAK